VVINLSTLSLYYNSLKIVGKKLWSLDLDLCVPLVRKAKAVFTSEIFGRNIPVALSLLFGKIYPTMN
jgi:hypothetical protein